MKLHELKNTVLLALALAIWSGCTRLLEEKSDMRLTTPETLQDNQALLDRATDVLGDFALSGFASSDEYYITDADWLMKRTNAYTLGSPIA